MDRSRDCSCIRAAGLLLVVLVDMVVAVGIMDRISIRCGGPVFGCFRTTTTVFCCVRFVNGKSRCKIPLFALVLCGELAAVERDLTLLFVAPLGR
jgi:hypothetical protein